ncbi:conserved membrane protein of unknown function [Petrocella atlantisensis]|uniref:DUF3267 domain-containing protein n=1 Tax=Petrocella atlantisensis TaxID=2173034 RepID=A0A3P7NVU3_9FIRM|nr:DUF3267 domain-containing protein [Petrocella atlantisensis]VDN47025.1 conserved membrane protein of unknown function [Petrocella atlantisensis]
MKYAKNIPPVDQELSNSLMNQGWKKIKEPSNLLTAFLTSIPIMAVCGLLSFFIITFFNATLVDFFEGMGTNRGVSISFRWYYIAFTLIMIYIHEMLHALWIPNFLKDENTFFGIKLWGGFVFTSQSLTKKRFIIICLAPFVTLSIVLPLILGGLNLLNGVLIILIMINAMASSVDILNALLILFQVPRGAMVVTNSFETYYKQIETVTAI